MARTRPSLKLGKTLSRDLGFRFIEADDLQYAWAAYRKGALNALSPEDLKVQEFQAAFGELITSRYDEGWTLSAGVGGKLIPVGFAFGFYPHYRAKQSLVMDTFVWFPWASSRNKVESAVNFLAKASVEIPMIGFVKMNDQRFVETVARHGILNRVGTSYTAFPGERAAIWETRGR